MRTQFVVGIYGTVSGDQLPALVPSSLQAIVIKQAGIDRFNLVGAIIAEQMI